MPHIDSTNFGSIMVDGKKYSQVMILGDEVLEREYKKLKELFGTSHKMGLWEQKSLLIGKPKSIVIGAGVDGILDVDSFFKEKVKEEGIELIAEKTPKAIKAYNEKYESGETVNALIHTTC